MDITLTWALPINQLPTDEYDVLYKVWDSAGTNNWVLANTTPLPPTTTTYTITGLNPNTIYRVAVTKSCVGGGSYVDEATYLNIVCPTLSFWHGPVVNSEQTLFYSVNYGDSTHVTNTEILVYDTTFDDRFIADCASGPTAIPIGRTSYQIADGCATPNIISCVKQGLDHKVPNNGASAVGYYGLDTMAGFNPLVCDGAITDPILFRAGNTYKFEVITVVDTVTLGVTIQFSTLDTSCNVVATAPVYTMPSNPVPNNALLSSAVCFDPATGLASFTTADGTGTTNISDYSFTYSTSDGSVTLPLLDSAGNIVASYNGSYNIYAPIKIQSNSVPAPGGGNPLGYTITNAVVSGGSTTYTYIGATNAFTIGQDVFINSVNPDTFNFPNTSKTITAATPNSFTVPSFAPAGTYQTGGTVSTYTELTDGMTVTVDLQPVQNVITLTNQNYTGLTLIQALNQVAAAINAGGTYTASAVVIAGLPYLKIDAPDSTYTSASVKFEGPNILTKGAPDILMTSYSYGTSSSIEYNGFLYAASGGSTAKITASEEATFTTTTDYAHTINLTVDQLVLVPEVPPTTVYSLDYVVDGGDYSLNITVAETGAWNQGYIYSADNTTINVYDPATSTLIDSKDISTLAGGSTKPIRLMEYNNTNNYLYVFVDGSSSNFYIILHTAVGSWSIGHTGTYAQTNYLKRSTITAWNNLTGGPTAAMGTVTSVPTQPIPCATIPCPIGSSANTNDGINSALFQDNTKAWATGVYSEDSYYVYNYNTQKLGAMLFYNGTFYYPQPGISGDTIRIGSGISTVGAKTPFLVSNGNSYGIFSRSKIVDYNATFASRTWANTSRYLIESGRSSGVNGFLNTLPINITNTTLTPDSYSRGLPTGEKALSSIIGLDGTSNYLLYEIADGGTCYNSTNNLIYVSLGNGTYQTINSSGTVSVVHQIYTDYPANTTLLTVPLQLVSDPTSTNVYGIIRDARLNSTADDKNIYILNSGGQTGIVDGSAKWNTPISGQIAFDSDKLYFTGKYNRTFYEYDLTLGIWNGKVVPSLYEKLDGAIYGDGTIIERVQGANYIGSGKFVVMNYLQETLSLELKYMYDVANLFVYDYVNNVIEQALIGTGVNTYSGATISYNTNYYGESFGINDYNNDYCYGGLSIKVDSLGNIFWKKSISDQIYISKSHTESGIAQLWGTGAGYVNSKLIRIWNIQSNGSLVQSNRTILDVYCAFGTVLYDTYYQKVIATVTGGTAGITQFYLINPKTLGGLQGANTIGNLVKYSNGSDNTVAGLTPTGANAGKQTNIYNVVVTPSDITYYVKPLTATVNGYFPHKYAVGEVVKITGVVSSPIGELNFPNGNVGNAVITSVTPISFTVSNYGTSASYISGGTVIDAEWANLYMYNFYTKIGHDNNGTILLFGNVTSGSTGINANSSCIIKYRPSDVLTQRENSKLVYKSILNLPVCSSTPSGFYSAGAAGGDHTNSYFIYVPSQNTYWMVGIKYPTCNTGNITNVTWDPITQIARYYIQNSFSVGKIVDISGVSPTTYNVSRVAITAVDTVNSPQQWFEISYTGSNPGTFVPPTPPLLTGLVSLSKDYIIKVIDATTFTDVATIDLGFNNAYVNDLYQGFFTDKGRFQYSPTNEEIYLYGYLPSTPIYTFSTVTNSLVKSSNFARMVIPYTKLTNIFSMEEVNGIPYFMATTSTDSPTRRWFRVDLGSRTYINDVHNELNVIVNDGSTTTTTNYNLYSLSNIADTFGQWKVTSDTTWASIPGGSNITVAANEIIEFTMFSTTNTLISVKNVTTSTVYDIPSYNNLATFPTYNTLNSVLTFVIKADSINLSNGDVLEFTFENPDNPNCQFINSVTINF